MKTSIASLFLLISIHASAQSDQSISSAPSKVNSGAGQKVRCFTAKKAFYVSVTFTITDSKIFKTDDPIHQDPSIPVRHYTTVTIEDPIKVEGKMFWNDDYEINFEKLGKGGKSNELTINLDSDGGGMLSGLNGSQEPVIADIISGTVGVVSSIVGAIKDAAVGLMGYGGTLIDGEKEQKEVQKIEIQKMIFVSGKASDDALKFTFVPNNFSYTIRDRIAKTDVTQSALLIIGDIPEVTITWTKLATAVKILSDSMMGNLPGGVLYRIPDQYRMMAVIKNNLFTKEFVSIDQVVLIPQTGALNFVPVPLLKGKRTVEIAFNPASGNLSSYHIKKESTVKASLSQASTSMDQLSGAVKDLRKDVANSKKDTSLEDEIARLTLENKKLELLKAKKDLQSGN